LGSELDKLRPKTSKNKAASQTITASDVQSQIDNDVR
jgi:hypothetical protein